METLFKELLGIKAQYGTHLVLSMQRIGVGLNLKILDQSQGRVIWEDTVNVLTDIERAKGALKEQADQILNSDQKLPIEWIPLGDWEAIA